MLRPVLLLLFPSGIIAAPVPEVSKAEKERKAFLRELGIPDVGQKLPPLPREYESDTISEAVVRANPVKYPLRAACWKAADILSDLRSKPLPNTVSFVGGLKKAKETIKGIQVSAATRTIELTEAFEELDELPATVLEAERSRRWRANHGYLLAAARQEVAALHEYNLALGRIITESVEPPKADDGFNALKLETASRMKSSKSIRESAEDASREFATLAKVHADTPWGQLADGARERPIGLTWVPTKITSTNTKKK